MGWRAALQKAEQWHVAGLREGTQDSGGSRRITELGLRERQMGEEG